MTWDILKQRGIDTACNVANWQPNGNGWSYPVYNSVGQAYEAKRWKAYDSNSSPKYRWIPQKPAKAKYYLLPDTIDAIKQEGGIVYLASGEPDVMTYRAAGYRNTLCWFDGESSIPETFAEDMQMLGVSFVYVYPDRDTTGMKMAASVRQALQDTDIIVVVKALPGEIGSKNDINWLWQEYKFDVDAFRATVLDAPNVDDVTLDLYTKADDAPATLPLDHAEYSGELPAEFIHAIESELSRRGVNKYNSDGWSNNIACIFGNHQKDDKTPAFAWNNQTHSSKCFKSCDRTWNAKETGEQLGIRLADYLPKHDYKTALAAPGQPLPPKTEVSADTPLYDDSHAVTLELIEILEGKRVPSVEPMEFPFKTMHQFGGFAEIMWPGKLVYISGVSGGGKTSLGEMFYEIMMRSGDDSIWFGPEWSALEMRVRALQRAGGITMGQFGKLLPRQIDIKNGVPLPQQRGKPLSAGEAQRNTEILRTINAWPGQAYYLRSDERLNSVSAILDTIRTITETKRKEGRNVKALFFDYLQRAPKNGYSGWDWSEGVVNAIKSLCEQLGLFGFIFIQPTKGDSKATRQGTELSEASGQGISDQQANLYITMTPVFNTDGNKAPYIKLQVVKNSMGKTGLMRLKWSPQHLAIVDDEYTGPIEGED